ncbi:glycoside hydrolase family 127 protein [Lacibacter sediminis]|uniref:Glycoside hydrolase family 127 protein n=1 Tax=Lacibacter sediminis TaxID=2760713 RepID=A0A7G5XDX4_9BACT|nr:beta-L-arabinofuranosidase domain-containing protein [Lacibacter sediminis]QNA43677.1 glycoside hydrolase family 127 protein [Lacibacter sediminis]
MKKNTFLLLVCLFQLNLFAQTNLQKIEFINFSQVNVTDAFWKPKIDKVATKTLAACIYQTEVATPRLKNFERVARNKGEQHEGIFYDDSDVFKALEAMAYSLKTHPNAEMEKKCDEWIDKIAAAQQPDGYLNTWYTLKGLQDRYTDMSMHEDYNAGHMIEAAVAYYNATGKRKFLDVCIKWADHFDALFGPGKRHWVTGHQELELALVKLYKTTKNEKYLKLADWLLSERGKRLAKGYTWTDWKDTAYAQDILPVKEQTQITGHAVRAMYMYTGAADVAAQTGDVDYMRAMKKVWEDVVYRNMYITGGIGSAGSNEGFSNDYDLPNEQAYCETCASVGMVFWNQRMNALTGDAMYMDVLERSLYNGALDGLSLTGDRFFYGNPLASRGQHQRREWFGTACCPANIARMVASLGDYIYAKSDDGIYMNLFVGSNTSIQLPKTKVDLKMETNYPWDGKVKVVVSPEKKGKFRLSIRIPGWYKNGSVPGDLYVHGGDAFSATPGIAINGKPVVVTDNDGYLSVYREWKQGDIVEFEFAMNTYTVTAKDSLKQNNNRIAIQRGPIVYCVEGADNNNKAWNIVLPPNTKFETIDYKIMDEPVKALTAEVPVVLVGEDGLSIRTEKRKIIAIPYYTWANRGKNEMQVWLPTTIKDVKINY